MRVKNVFEHPLRKTMINRLLSQVRNVNIDDDAPLESKITLMYKSCIYKEIIRPLVIIDREVNQLSWRQLEIKYQVTINQLRWIVNDFSE